MRLPVHSPLAAAFVTVLLAGCGGGVPQNNVATSDELKSLGPSPVVPKLSKKKVLVKRIDALKNSAQDSSAASSNQ